MLTPFASAWPLRSEGIGAGVGGSACQLWAVPAGNKENRWRMNFFPKRELRVVLSSKFRPARAHGVFYRARRTADTDRITAAQASHLPCRLKPGQHRAYRLLFAVYNPS